jgi:hypothetical protein
MTNVAYAGIAMFPSILAGVLFWRAGRRPT